MVMINVAMGPVNVCGRSGVYFIIIEPCSANLDICDPKWRWQSVNLKLSVI